MTVAQIITGYIHVCGRFGITLQVEDGVLYLYNGNARLGYFTQGLQRAGSGLLIQNAYGFLLDLCQKHDLKLDFKAPGEFIAYTPTQFGIVPLPPHKAPEPVIIERRPASDFQSVEYAL